MRRVPLAAATVGFVLLHPVSGWTGSSPPAQPSVSKFVSSAWGEMAVASFAPEPRQAGARSPLLIFFHGGGWKHGSMRQFSRQARYLTAHAQIVVASVDYPLTGDPIYETQAAIAATCWIRAKAESYGVDLSRVALAGGSAGGQLAVSALLTSAEGIQECDGQSPPLAQALILFNPALDLTGGAEASAGRDLKSVSPIDLLGGRSLPPTLILQGDADRLTPIETARRFVEKAEKNGATDVELIAFPGRRHGFFNNENDGDLEATTVDAERFLERLGWLNTSQ